MSILDSKNVKDFAVDDECKAPRGGVLSWDDYFLSLAFLTAMRSKDPATQVGAVIVNDLNRIIGVGYNGFPTGIPDEALPWSKTSKEGPLGTKFPYVVHAEVNAILNKNAESCRGCRLYCTLHPCNECAKVIIQAGIRTVIFASNKNHMKVSGHAAAELFRLAGCTVRRHRPDALDLNISLRCPEDEPLPEPAAGFDSSPRRREIASLPVARSAPVRGLLYGACACQARGPSSPTKTTPDAWRPSMVTPWALVAASAAAAVAFWIGNAARSRTTVAA